MQDVVIVDRVYFHSLLEMQADDEYNVVALCKLMRRMLCQGLGKLICPGGEQNFTRKLYGRCWTGRGG